LLPKKTSSHPFVHQTSFCTTFVKTFHDAYTTTQNKQKRKTYLRYFNYKNICCSSK